MGSFRRLGQRMECLEWNLVAASIASVHEPMRLGTGSPRMLQSRQRSGPSDTINIVIIVLIVIIVHGLTSFAGTSSLPSRSQTSLFETLSLRTAQMGGVDPSRRRLGYTGPPACG